MHWPASAYRVEHLDTTPFFVCTNTWAGGTAVLTTDDFGNLVDVPSIVGAIQFLTLE